MIYYYTYIRIYIYTHTFMKNGIYIRIHISIPMKPKPSKKRFDLAHSRGATGLAGEFVVPWTDISEADFWGSL